jgi:hypothetical protein
MPQFDFYSFSGQVLWTLLGFSFFYFFILKYYIVYFSEIFKIRQKLYNQKKYKIDDVENYKKKLYTAFFKN